MPLFKLHTVHRLALAAVPFALMAAAPSVDTPKLWRVEVVDRTSPARAIFVCADKPVRQAFVNATPEVNGKPCVLQEPSKRRGNLVTLRCVSGDSLAVASSAVTGDQQRDFTVSMRISTRPSDPTKAEPRGEFAQVRRYRIAGACPNGWAVGDSAAQGDTAVVNSLSGARRAGAAPFKPPSVR